MNGWAIFQFVLNLALVAVGVAIYVRAKRPRKDDPRLSKGLQLLQSKIAILEDLSDRTDNQVKQLAEILDQKAKMVHEHADMIQQHLNLVEKSIERSMEVSRIFQDKIPHKEIIERQNTIKYIQAARMAHQGISVDEIAQKVDIPKSELDFIAKVNKDRLMFSEKDLPSWAMDALDYKEPAQNAATSNTRDMTSVYEGLTFDKYVETEDQKIGNDFKQSIQNYRREIEEISAAEQTLSVNLSTNEEPAETLMTFVDQVENQALEVASTFEVGGAESISESFSAAAEIRESVQVEEKAPEARKENILVQKIGAIIEKKLGFTLDQPEPKKTSFQIQNQNDAVKNTMKLKNDIAKQTLSKDSSSKAKTVRPFVFKKIDKEY